MITLRLDVKFRPELYHGGARSSVANDFRRWQRRVSYPCMRGAIASRPAFTPPQDST